MDKLCTFPKAFRPTLVLLSYVASAVVLVNMLLIRQKAARALKRGRESQGKKIPQVFCT
jgi:hypothetical protein